MAVTALAATGSAVEQNQQVQHAKGAAQAEATAADNAVKTQTAADAASTQQKADQGSATQAAALAALRASMSASTEMGGSILTSPTGTAPAPTAGKSLLGV
jgi:hypothetical protein